LTFAAPKGVKVDKRADISAFGCVQFEMLAGRRAFAGDTAADTWAAVLHHEPPWTALPSDTPTEVRTVLMRWLEKDAKERMRDIGAVVATRRPRLGWIGNRRGHHRGGHSQSRAVAAG
jgi:serine/threonine protein kinase